MLMSLPVRGSHQSVGQFLAAKRMEREVWFRRPDDSLLACVFTPTRGLCRGGVLRTITFHREPSGLAAESLEEICVD